MKKTTLLLFLLLIIFTVMPDKTFAATALSEDQTSKQSANTISLDVTSMAPYVGETVAISAKISPDVTSASLVALRWEWSGGLRNVRKREGNGIDYEVQDKPATITATLFNQADGKDINSAVINIAPQQYAVSIKQNNPNPAASFQQWDNDKKSIVTVQGVSVKNRFSLEAVITPKPKTSNLRYLWTCADGTFIASQDKNVCVVYRDEIGTASVSLQVLTPNNLEAGAAQISFDINISSDAVEKSSSLEKGTDRWSKALVFYKSGDFENAFAQAQTAFEELIAGGMSDETIRKELNTFKQARDNHAKAIELRSMAASLWRDNKLEEALSVYSQAQAINANPEVEQNIARIRGAIAEEQRLKERSGALAQEADSLAKEEKFEEALKKYEESLSLYSNPAVRASQADVEGRFKAIQRKVDLARSLHEIALTLESQGNLDGALSKMAEAKSIWELPESDADIQRVHTAIQERMRLQNEAVEITKEASALENKGILGQGDPEILTQSVEKYRKAQEIWPDVDLERSIKRVNSHIDRINAEIEQSEFMAKEAELLEKEGHLEEALSKYNTAEELRTSPKTKERITALSQQIDSFKKLADDSKKLHVQAEGLERQGKLDEALVLAKKGEASHSSNELSTMIKRLENAISVRNSKVERAKNLAQQAENAKSSGDLEKALDFYIESNSIWKSLDVEQAINVLKGQVNENRNVEKRALELYKDGVVLEREGKFEVAEEKLQSSLTLKSTPDAEKLLAKVKEKLAEKNWQETLKAQPLNLRVSPPLPRIGQKTTVRIENGVWNSSSGLTYKWEFSGNIKENSAIEGGKAYSFYPADSSPATLVLTVFKGNTELALSTKTISVSAEPYSLNVIFDEASATVKRWNVSLKRLDEVNEFATGTDIQLMAEISPLPDERITYVWNADQDSVVEDSKKSETKLRRALPGTSKISVTAKDSRNIELGSASVNVTITVDKNDIIRDQKRYQAWNEWQEALRAWNDGKRIKAIEIATKASVLDPSDPDITSGFSHMKEDMDKMEYSARLLSESSSLLLHGKTEEALEKAIKAESLWPSEAGKNIKNLIAEENRKNSENKVIASQLRAEGEALLAQGDKVEALLRFQSSLLLEDNEAISKDVASLIGGINSEKAVREEARAIRAKADALIEKKRYVEAVELYTKSLQLLPDTYLESYLALLNERALEEKIAREKSTKLRKAGDSLMEDKKVAEAIVKYKESLTIWHDAELEKIVKAEEERIAQAAASKLRKEAEDLIKAKKPEEALLKYTESLKHAFDSTADAYVKKAEAAKLKKRVDTLIAEGDSLLKQKQPEEALSRYRLAQKDAPKNKDLNEKIKKLELILTQAVGGEPESGDVVLPTSAANANIPEEGSSLDLTQADALFKEANALYLQKRYKEALEKYNESYKLSQSKKLKEFIDQLESTLKNVEEASRLVLEGNNLYKSKKYSEALDKYKESLKHHKNPEVEAFIPKVEALIKQ